MPAPQLSRLRVEAPTYRFFYFSLLLILQVPKVSQSLLLEMHIENFGTIQGEQLRETQQWLNIPYAKPIASNLFGGPSKTADRFESPRPFEAPLYETIVNFGSTRMKCHGLYANEHENEDCLRLSIWSPNSAKNCRILIFLDSRDLMYHTWGPVANNALLQTVLLNGTLLSDYLGSMIVVANYRGGPQGFMQVDKDKLGQNIGIEDAIMSIEWVQKHARMFGADPSSITLMVVSSGVPVAIQMLLKKPDLVKRLIILSGNPLSRQTMFRTERTANQILDLFNCPYPLPEWPDLKSCLEKMSILELNKMARKMKMFDQFWIPESEKLVRESLVKLNKLDILIGINLNAGGYFFHQNHPNMEFSRDDFYTTVDYENDIDKLICATENLNGLQCDLIKHEYLPVDRNTDAYSRYQFMSSLLLDKNIVLPMNEFIENLEKFAYVRPYVFALDRVSPLDLTFGALQDNQSAMGAEAQYFFGMPNAVFVDWESTDREIMAHMMDMLSKFIHTGRPTLGNKTAAEPNWVPYNSNSQTFLHIGTKSDHSDIQVARFFKKRTLDFWKNLMPRLAGIREDCGLRVFPTVQPNLGNFSPDDLDGDSQESETSNQNMVLITIVSMLLVLVLLLCGIVLFLIRRISTLNRLSLSRVSTEKLQLKVVSDNRKKNGVINLAEYQSDKHDSPLKSTNHKSLTLNGNVSNRTNMERFEISMTDDNLITNTLVSSRSPDNVRSKGYIQSDTVPSYVNQGHGSGDLSPCSDKLSSTTESDATCQSRANSLQSSQQHRISLLKSESNKEVTRDRGSPLPVKFTGTLLTPNRMGSPHSNHSNNNHHSFPRSINFGSVKETDLVGDCHGSRSRTPLMFGGRNHSRFPHGTNSRFAMS